MVLGSDILSLYRWWKGFRWLSELWERLNWFLKRPKATTPQAQCGPASSSFPLTSWASGLLFSFSSRRLASTPPTRRWRCSSWGMCPLRMLGCILAWRAILSGSPIIQHGWPLSKVSGDSFLSSPDLSFSSIAPNSAHLFVSIASFRWTSFKSKSTYSAVTLAGVSFATLTKGEVFHGNVCGRPQVQNHPCMAPAWRVDQTFGF